jgi:nifR3 family TIM-barrel protein
MAGVTNVAFRTLCREFGAGLYISEMIMARPLVEGNRKTRRLAGFGAKECPRSLQLYGSDPRFLAEATRYLVGEGAVDHLDLNFGCPVRKVTAQGGGAAIPIKPRLLARLVRAVVQAAGEIPVSIKVRLGIEEGLMSFLSSGRIATEEGCVAMGLHARTAAQLYDGTARWTAIGELKAAIPALQVLGNGDIWECWDALRMMRETGCDGVIVGRGCLGRPWLFRELNEVFRGRLPQAPPRLGEVLRVLRRHAQLLQELFGPEQGILELRKWCGWYLKGFPGTGTTRAALFQIKNLEQFEERVADLALDLPFPVHALRARRAKRAGGQKVALPAGYLDNLEDDQPPSFPRDPRRRAAIAKALQGG